MYKLLIAFLLLMSNLIVYAQSSNHILSLSPNPSYNAVEIQYTIEKPSSITLSISDDIGIEVRRLIDNVFIGQGLNKIIFDASDLTSGIYFVTIEGYNFKVSKKFVIIK